MKCDKCGFDLEEVDSQVAKLILRICLAFVVCTIAAFIVGAFTY